MKYAMQENYDRLIPFGWLVNSLKNKKGMKKLDDVTRPGVMVGYCENSIEYLV